MSHRYLISNHTSVTFGRTVTGDVVIEKLLYGARVRLALTADEWDTIVDRSPYMRMLAERYPDGV